ncbi:hypothetical protein BDV12DRAFT_11332 [Aspergillus spectabilis]
MAQKASKTLAARNTSVLLRTHLTSLLLHILHLTLHIVFTRPRSLKAYYFLALPTLLIEFYLDRIGRPTHAADGSLKSPGEDLGAAGLTEYMWDVLYWTWGCIGAVCLFGDRAWWLWAVIPGYSVWLAYSTVTGMRSGLAGLGGGDAAGARTGTGGGAESKRQRKMEKRGGQRMQYR